MPISPEQAPDAVFSGDGGPTLSNLAVDDSGTATDLSVGTSSVYESSSTRADLTTNRTVDFLATFSDTDTGYLFSYHTGRMQLSSGGQIDCYVNGSSVITHTIANFTAATDEDFVISWATEPNPLTTGAGDAQRSELHVWNTTLGTYESSSTTHAVQVSPGGGGATFIWGAQTSGGASAFTGNMTELRLCSRFHSSTETANCYVGQTSAPTLLGVEKVEWPVPDVACGLGNDGQFVGPVYVMAAKAQQFSDLRLCGPLVNEICSGDWAEDSTWTMTDPDAAAFTWHLEFLRRRPMPKQCNRLVFTAQVQQNAASAQDLLVRFYCSDRPGLIELPPCPDTRTTYYDTVTRNADDGLGTNGGALIRSAAVRVATDDDGYTYVWIGFDASSVTDYRIRSWAVEPIYLDSPGGFGGGGGFG